MSKVFKLKIVLSCILIIFSSCMADEAVETSSVSSPTAPSTKTSSAQMKKSFTPCTDSSQCNLNEGFICRDNRCVCAYDDLAYEAETRRCIANVGGQCGFFIGSPNSTMAHCPENSMCVWNKDAFKPSYQYIEKYCICMSGFYKEASSGKCVPFAKFSEKCNTTRRCDMESDLICSKTSSTCQCPFAADQFYDAEQQKCISYVGGNCTMYCVENAFCENYNPEIASSYQKGWRLPEGKREYLSESICQCQPGYEPSKDRRCKLIPPGYNSPCYGEEESCDTSKNLLCIDKVCQCMNPIHQSYNYDLGRCIGSVGDVCDPAVPENCVPRANCILNETLGNHVWKCQCGKGFTGTPSKKCMKGYKESCDNELCNVFAGMACINKTCVCLDSLLKYDEAKLACVSSVGAPCGKVYFPIEFEEVTLNGHISSSMRHPYTSNSIRNQYMKMRSMCPECDGYHVSCPVGSVCTSESDVLMIVRGKEKRKCMISKT